MSNDFQTFLSQHSVKGLNAPITHTRIGAKEFNIYGGSYHIPENELDQFYALYYDYVFVKGYKEYLTETQNGNCMAVDLDFRYSYDKTEKQYTKQTIEDIICLYGEVIKEHLKVEENVPFNVFAYEKAHVNRVADKQIVKDGLHIVFAIKVDFQTQLFIRQKVLEQIKDVVELPLINTWEEVLDEGISKGSNKWQLYGSRKPNHEAYELTEHYLLNLKDGNMVMNKQDITNLTLKDNFKMLSVQYNNNYPKFNAKVEPVKTEPLKINVVSPTSSYSVSGNSNKHIDLLVMLGSKNYSRSDWVSICGWCHTYTDKQFFLDFVNITWRDEAEKMWDSMKSKDLPIYWMETFAKRTNNDIYKTWLEKWNVYFIPADQIDDPYSVATIISNTLKSRLVLCNEKWFMLTSNNLWQQQKEPSFYIISELRKYIDESNKKIVYQISQTDGEQKDKLVEISKTYLKSYKLISSSGYLNVLTKYLKTPLADNSFENKLDNNSGFMAFKNGIVNLETKVFRAGIQADDFITHTIDYDYCVANADKKQFVKNVLLKILNNNTEHLEYFLSLIGFTFIGNPHLQKSIYFCVDKTDKSAGDNGKTFFFDILEYLMPIYTKKTDKSFFEDGNKKLHKQLAMMKGKRLVYADEFNEKKVNAEFMKIIGDGLKIENEIMFGTSEMINIMFKAWILTNHIPNIDAKEQAVYNRYNQISYGSHFDRTGKRIYENVDRLEFIADPTLGDRIKNEYYNEVFELIIEYANKYYVSKLPPIPKQFLTDAEATKMKNDTFGSWFEENCEIDSNERVALKVLMNSSGMTDKAIKEGMLRLGFKYDKDLMKLGKDTNNKHYKGGFIGCRLKPEQLDDDDTDSEKE